MDGKIKNLSTNLEIMKHWNPPLFMQSNRYFRYFSYTNTNKLEPKVLPQQVQENYLEEIVETYQELAQKIENNSVQTDLKEIKEEIANLSSSKTTMDPAVIEKINSAPDGGINNSAGLSELKYYIVELMKDQNEIRQIVKDLRELLEKNEEN